MKKVSNVVVVDTCTKRVTALKAHVSNKAEIPIAGKAYKAAAVVGIYQTSLDIRAALSTKRADVKATIVESVNAEVLRRAADRALKGWVVNTYGADSQQAHDFGFPPPKAPARTVENKAEAKLLAEATRKARHTMGKKQKLQVKGTLPVPTVPAAPAPQTVQAAAPAVVSTPAPVAAAPAPVAPAPAPATNGVAPVQNGAPHA
jgi:hypothetical protein